MTDNFCKFGKCSECGVKTCKRRRRANEGEYSILLDFAYVPDTATGVFTDIGTTTIATVRFKNGKAEAWDTRRNPQYTLGADVLSRISAQAFGKGDELIRLLRDGVEESIRAVGRTDEQCYISANTVMTNMYLGNDCRSLGVYPFKAPSLGGCVADDKVILPCASGFIGGDVLSGLFMCDFDINDEVNVFIDLGTNTEMAIGGRSGILTASAAGGPAFEGGTISCGVGSVEGAICSVSVADGTVKTIGGGRPIGICGTGIVDLLARMLKCGIMDGNGRILNDEPFCVCDAVLFTQADVREIQTAKGAVRAGLELMLKRYGACEDEIRNIYIAGGFGKWLDIDNACAIGLLPKRFKDKYRAVGNASLGGAVKLAETENAWERTKQIGSLCRELSIATDDEFSELFLDYMNFEEV